MHILTTPATAPPQVSLPGVFACGPDGHLLLVSPCGEAVRVNLAKGAPVRWRGVYEMCHAVKG